MKVLIAVDGSECSAAAIDAAIERCWPKDIEFLVMNAVEPFIYQYAMAGPAVGPAVEAQIEYAKYCKQMVDDYVQKLKNALGNVKVTGETVDGSPADCILEMAKEWNADLILIGSHGRTGLPKIVLGSVACSVVSHARCSVEVIKPKHAHEKSTQAKNPVGCT